MLTHGKLSHDCHTPPLPRHSLRIEFAWRTKASMGSVDSYAVTAACQFVR